ncbi:tRNA 5-(aminomethyl)-2-thiouridylate-methyltransferase MnmM [Faecalimonas sp.]
MKKYQITEWCHHFIKNHVENGEVCIDATAGNGNDTLLLAELVGEKGKVYAFDIQEQALQKTRERLEEKGLDNRVELILESHEKMEQWVKEEVSCVVFNFGYLPGGNHFLSTKTESSIKAIQGGLSLLKKGGMMSLCIYSGGDSGFEEKEGILQYLHRLDSKKYLVIVSQYYNRPNNPPIPAIIIKL